MIHLPRLRYLILSLALACCARGAEAVAINDATSGYYGRAAVAYGFFGDFKDTAGPAVALGKSFGRGRHAIEADLSYFSSQVASYGNNKVKFMPLLLAYRYVFSTAPNGFGGYVGGMLGAMRQEATFSSYGWSAKTTATVFTGGGQTGLTYGFNRTASAELGLKVLGVASSDIASSGRISILTLGLAFKF